MKKYFKIILPILFLILTIVMFLSSLSNRMSKTTNISNESLKVHFIDVGQGDCTLITCEGKSMLIDAGDNSKGTTVQLYLKKHNIKSLDYVIGTHPDSDHIGGLDVIIYKFDCKKIIMPNVSKDTVTYDDVIYAMKNKNYSNTLPVVGEKYKLGSATFTIIAPNNGYDISGGNNDSVGILLKHGKNKFIFLGDAEEEAENDILKNGINIDADVYKVSHHGSKTASSEKLLNKISPKYAVVSCGIDNRYGHPHARVLNLLRKRNVELFRTDEQGSIIATSNKRKITWNCSNKVTWKTGENTRKKL